MGEKERDDGKNEIDLTEDLVSETSSESASKVKIHNKTLVDDETDESISNFKDILLKHTNTPGRVISNPISDTSTPRHTLLQDISKLPLCIRILQDMKRSTVETR